VPKQFTIIENFEQSSFNSLKNFSKGTYSFKNPKMNFTAQIAASEVLPNSSSFTIPVKRQKLITIGR